MVGRFAFATSNCFSLADVGSLGSSLHATACVGVMEPGDQFPPQQGSKPNHAREHHGHRPVRGCGGDHIAPAPFAGQCAMLLRDGFQYFGACLATTLLLGSCSLVVWARYILPINHVAKIFFRGQKYEGDFRTTHTRAVLNCPQPSWEVSEHISCALDLRCPPCMHLR